MHLSGLHRFTRTSVWQGWRQAMTRASPGRFEPMRSHRKRMARHIVSAALRALRPDAAVMCKRADKLVNVHRHRMAAGIAGVNHVGATALVAKRQAVAFVGPVYVARAPPLPRLDLAVAGVAEERGAGESVSVDEFDWHVVPFS